MLFVHLKKSGSRANIKTDVINPSTGDVGVTVVTTGIVEPRNRLEIKPSISGRIEEILVNEGELIKKGDVLARMSSTERATLIDAARSQGEEDHNSLRGHNLRTAFALRCEFGTEFAQKNNEAAAMLPSG